MRSFPLFLWLGLVACGSTRPEGPPIEAWEAMFPEVVDPERSTEGPRGFFRVRPPDREQREALDEAIKVYVAGDDAAFAAKRDELARDPVAAYWLTRTLVWFVIEARVAAPADAEVAMVSEPVWERPIRHIRALGPDAVPALVLDLLRNARADRVDLGGELLEAIGPAGLARWQGVFDLDDARARRRAAAVVAAWDQRSPETSELLARLARDADFGVRGAACLGLAKDPEQVPALAAALGTETDPFVQQKIVRGLASHRSRVAAAAVVDYMGRCQAAHDERGVLAADETLRKMSGWKQRATLQAWQSWLSTLRE